MSDKPLDLWRIFLILGLCALIAFHPAFLFAQPTGDENVFLVFVGGPLVLFWYIGRYIWPTPYRTEHADGHLLRIHRRTGKAEIFTPKGWEPVTSDSPLA